MSTNVSISNSSKSTILEIKAGVATLLHNKHAAISNEVRILVFSFISSYSLILFSLINQTIPFLIIIHTQTIAEHD